MRQGKFIAALKCAAYRLFCTLARLTGFTEFGGLHVTAAALAHVVIRHPRVSLDMALRRLNTRHPAEGKRQADQENKTKPQVAFHGVGV